jgi:hypothetical protein
MTQRRRWLQLHLSTLLVLTMVAGVLLGLNIWSERVSVDDVDASLGVLACAETGNPFSPYDWYRHGWPASFHFGFQDRSWSYTIKEMLALDIAVALALLVAVGVVCEYHIRRKPQP